METTQIVLLIVLSVILIAFIIWQIIKHGYRKTVIDFIVAAEEEMRDNEAKFNMVVNGIIVRLPFPFNFMPIGFVRRFVQKVFDEIKVALDYQKTDH